MVPDEGIEPPTFGLQNRCSTAELIRRPEWGGTYTGPVRDAIGKPDVYAEISRAWPRLGSLEPLGGFVGSGAFCAPGGGWTLANAWVTDWPNGKATGGPALIATPLHIGFPVIQAAEHGTTLTSLA